MDPNLPSYSPAAEPGPMLTPNPSLVRAWATIARRPSRQIFSAWAQVADRRWIITSLVVAYALRLITLIADALRDILVPRPAPSSSDYLFGVPSTAERVVYLLVAQPVTQLALLLAIPYAVALVMPPASGPIRIRFEQVLRPWALAQVIASAAAVAVGIPMLMLDVASRSPLSLSSCMSLLIGFGAAIYTLTAEVNALSSGSGRRRWTVFGLYALASAVVFAVLLYLPATIAYYAFGFHLFPL